jgi:hypothetical protein
MFRNADNCIIEITVHYIKSITSPQSNSLHQSTINLNQYLVLKDNGKKCYTIKQEQMNVCVCEQLYVYTCRHACN